MNEGTVSLLWRALSNVSISRCKFNLVVQLEAYEIFRHLSLVCDRGKRRIGGAGDVQSSLRLGCG